MAGNTRAQRLIRFLLLLQANDRITAREVAERLGASVRTVQRDVEALVEAGVPVTAARGASGGYRLASGARSRLTALSGDEAATLLLSGTPGRAELGLGAVVASAQLKVLAALPPELRDEAARAARLFHFDSPGWFRSRERAPYLAAVAAALWRDRRIDIRYRGPGGVVRRVLSPMGLVLKGGAWYLVALSRRGPRVYRLSRVERVAIREEPARRPADFDLPAFWESWLLEFEGSRPRIDVRVAIHRSAALELRMVVGPEARSALAMALARADGDWVDASIPFERPEHAHRDLLGLGDLVEVVSPPELRDRMAATAGALAARYRVPG